MRIAILSDIHGNLEALEAVLEDAKAKGNDHMVCLGDVVGYGADPQICVERVREKAWKRPEGEVVVRGNHDDAVASLRDSDFNPAAKTAVRWTRNQLSESALEWLGGLPMTIEYPEFVLVHSSPHKPRNWTYVTTYDEALDAFLAFNQQVAFIGHSHVPFLVFVDEAYTRIEKDTRGKVRMMRGFRYLVNVGSVGQPRDGDPRASYVSLDLEEETIENIRVPYPIEIAMTKIRNVGLPHFLADRLLKGR